MNENDSIIVQRDPLPIQVLNKLMDWIMDGKLTMGEKLNTEELARQLLSLIHICGTHCEGKNN